MIWSRAFGNSFLESFWYFSLIKDTSYTTVCVTKTYHDLNDYNSKNMLDIQIIPFA